MSAVSRLADWYNLTREQVLTGPEDVIIETSLNSYVLGQFLMNRPPQQVVKKGTQIVEWVRLSSASNFGGYSPGDPVVTSRASTKSKLTWGWRFFRNHLPVTEEELEFNDGDELTSFKDFEATQMGDLYADHFDGVERLLFKQPNSSTMETASAERGDPFSLPAYISENSTTYRPPSSTWSATTVAGVTSSTTNWTNQIVTYTSGAPTDSATGILPGLDKLIRVCTFNVPTNVAGASKAFTRLGGPEKRMLFTNGNGMDLWRQLVRAGNQSFEGNGDKSDPAYPRTVYNGAQIIHASRLDLENLDESSGSYTGQPYPAGKPRYFFVDGRTTFPVFHRDRFLRFQSAGGGAIQPDTEVMFLSSRLQIVCKSRKRNGILKPAA